MKEKTSMMIKNKHRKRLQNIQKTRNGKDRTKCSCQRKDNGLLSKKRKIEVAQENHWNQLEPPRLGEQLIIKMINEGRERRKIDRLVTGKKLENQEHESIKQKQQRARID